MSQSKKPLKNRSLLSSAIRSVIAAASLSVPISPAFAACSSNTISATVTENCVLSDGESVTINNTGTIRTPTATSDAINISGSNNISVTVDSGGSVLGGTGLSGTGILLNGGTPSVNVTITNTGTISGQAAITVESISDISGGIVNNVGGVISGSTAAIFVYSSSDISGGITNSGTISGATGIFVSSADISGGITNSGTISGSGTRGIQLATGADVSGGITNSGTISGAKIGITVTSTDISGAITNNGTITGLVNDGISVSGTSADISGGIINNSTISGTGATLGTGISVDSNADISGGIVNNVGATIVGSGSLGAGILITGAVLSGGITNSGTISGNVGIQADGIGGGIINNAGGTLSGTGLRAISLATGSAVTITNSGTIIGQVDFENGTLNLNAGSITGLVLGTAGSTVNVNGTIVSGGNFSGITNFNINTGGALNLGHNVAATTVSNAGTLTVNAGAAVTITGNYTQTANGIFQTGATSASTYGQLVVTGTADLSASNQLSVLVSSGDTLTDGDTLDNVLSSGTLITGALTVTDNSALWNFNAVDDGSNNIDLMVSQASTITDAVSGAGTNSVSSTDWALGVAQTLDSISEAGATGDIATVIGEINSLSTLQEVSDAVGQMVPLLVGSSAQMTLLTLNDVATKVNARIASQQGLSAGDTLLSDRHFWIKLLVTTADLNERDGVPGYELDGFGLVLGIDGEFSTGLRVGGALAYSKTEADGKDLLQQQSVEGQSAQAVVYASWSDNKNWFANYQIAVGVGDNEAERHIQFGSIDRLAEGEYDSRFVHLYASTGILYRLNDTLTISPELSLAYTHIYEESYDEKGAGGLSLDVGSNNEESLVLGVAGQVAYSFNSNSLLTAHLGVGYDTMASEPGVSASFSGAGTAFTVRGAELDEWLWQAGVGLELVKSDSLEIHFNYEYEARDDFNAQALSATARFLF